MKKILELKDISYRYPDGTGALSGVSMEISEGESIAIVGPNGGGKSTLLMILSALVPPSEGEIWIFGEKMDEKLIDNAKKMFPLRKRLGIMFQDPDVQLFSATVFDDVAFGPINYGISGKNLKKMVMGALRYLGIEHLAERHPYELSGGEKRKAALATTIVSDPEVLIMDEPTADLDPESRNEVVDVINRFRETGKTVIVATHDMEMVPEVAGRVIVLNKSIMMDGRIEDVLIDKEVMEKAGLERPYSVRILEILKKMGIPTEDFPFKTEEALKWMEHALSGHKED